MTRRYLLHILFCLLMAASLSIISCGSSKSSGTYNETQYADPMVPKYGGTHDRIRTVNWNSWDYVEPPYFFNISLMGEELLGGDWTKGPAGTGENDWTSGYGGFTDTLTGRLAEGFELPDNETIVFHIRSGIHWWDKPPANGRELTADDIGWNINRHFSSPQSYTYTTYTSNGTAPLSVNATDRYTLRIKVVPEQQVKLLLAIGDHMWMLCPDAVEANGGEPLTNWQQFIGTGPFIISNYVEDSYTDYVRNSDYWQTDPLHPENRLPYPHGLKDVFIRWPSSEQLEVAEGAFLSGQVDSISTVSMTLLHWDEVDHLLKKFPALKMKEFAGAGVTMIWPRLDNTTLPFTDIRVRQAMNLAVNHQELVDDYYMGHADLLPWPYPDLPVFHGIYTPLAEQSKEVQDLFTYNPDKAEELMTEAGYPEGFSFHVYAPDPDFLTLISKYLERINIDMKVNYLNAYTTGAFNDATYGYTNLLQPQKMMNVVAGSFSNFSRINDPRIQEAYDAVTKNAGINDTEVTRILKEIGPYELGLTVPIFLPAPHSFVMWWPWLQNYYGAVGGGGYDNLDEYLMYIWIDTDMKAALGR